jgi:release factor glutamine methyltransferase
MAEQWTVRRILAWITADLEKRGNPSARLDADLLVACALGQQRIALYMDLDRPLIEAELLQIRKLVERRRAREPVAYILGEREFYGRRFEVTRDVLIPRPDTETLVDHALALLRAGVPAGRALDLCTGSGAIAVTLTAELPELRMVATDVSQGALSVAARNAAQLGVAERVEFRAGDLFAALPTGERFAMITVNPPYIGAHEIAGLAVDVRDFEPRLALEAGSDALSFYRRIARDAAQYLQSGASLLMEVGFTQAPQVAALLREQGFVDVRAWKDLANIERVVMGRYAGDA